MRIQVHQQVRSIPFSTASSKGVADGLDERLLAAAKSDNEDMLDEALAELEDINFADGFVYHILFEKG